MVIPTFGWKALGFWRSSSLNAIFDARLKHHESPSRRRLHRTEQADFADDTNTGSQLPSQVHDLVGCGGIFSLDASRFSQRSSQ
jgi:hypothetical protein